MVLMNSGMTVTNEANPRANPKKPPSSMLAMKLCRRFFSSEACIGSVYHTKWKSAQTLILLHLSSPGHVGVLLEGLVMQQLEELFVAAFPMRQHLQHLFGFSLCPSS